MDNSKEFNKFKVAGKTKVIDGTILTPWNAGLRFILSINNMKGSADGNPLLPIFDKKWKKVREDSKGFYANKTGAYKLGSVAGITPVQSDTWVIHLLCQDESLKVDLQSLEACLKKVSSDAVYEKASVHVSSVLCDKIPELQDLLTQHLVNNGVSVYYYKEP